MCACNNRNFSKNSLSSKDIQEWVTEQKIQCSKLQISSLPSIELTPDFTESLVNAKRHEKKIIIKLSLLRADMTAYGDNSIKSTKKVIRISGFSSVVKCKVNVQNQLYFYVLAMNN